MPPTDVAPNRSRATGEAIRDAFIQILADEGPLKRLLDGEIDESQMLRVVRGYLLPLDERFRQSDFLSIQVLHDQAQWLGKHGSQGRSYNITEAEARARAIHRKDDLEKMDWTYPLARSAGGGNRGRYGVTARKLQDSLKRRIGIEAKDSDVLLPEHTSWPLDQFGVTYHVRVRLLGDDVFAVLPVRIVPESEPLAKASEKPIKEEPPLPAPVSGSTDVAEVESLRSKIKEGIVTLDEAADTIGVKSETIEKWLSGASAVGSFQLGKLRKFLNPTVVEDEEASP